MKGRFKVRVKVGAKVRVKVGVRAAPTLKPVLVTVLSLLQVGIPPFPRYSPFGPSTGCVGAGCKYRCVVPRRVPV